MSNIIERTSLILIRMSKCQKNKYAAGGKCGSMSNSAGPCPTNPEQVGEINGNFAALLASREKQDLLFSAKPVTQPKALTQAIVLHNIVKRTSKSDIDTVLEGDF